MNLTSHRIEFCRSVQLLRNQALKLRKIAGIWGLGEFFDFYFIPQSPNPGPKIRLIAQIEFCLNITMALVLSIMMLACTPTDPAQSTATSAAATISYLQTQLTPTSDSAPTVAISVLGGTHFEQGQRIEVQFEATDKEGVERVELLANDRIVSSETFVAQPDAVFIAKISWTPDDPGTYALQIQAFNPSGGMSASEQVVVEVEPNIPSTRTPTPTPFRFPQQQQPTARPVDTPTPRPTVTPTASPTPVGTPTPNFPYLIVRANPGLNVRKGPSTRYQTLGVLRPGDMVEILGQNDIGAGKWWQIRYPPSSANGVGWVSASADYSESHNTAAVTIASVPPTPVPLTSTPSPAPVPVVQQPTIEFGADRTQIQAGECVTVFWNVTNVQEVYYRGQGVLGENQTRVECPSLTEFYELRVVGNNGEVETRTLRIEVAGTSYRTSEIDVGKGINFDDGGSTADDDDGDFKWVDEDDDTVFRKWNDDDDLGLVPVGPAGLDIITQDDCRWALDNLNDTDSIDPFVGLAACFRTDERRLGKLRFEDTDDDADIQWALW